MNHDRMKSLGGQTNTDDTIRHRRRALYYLLFDNELKNSGLDWAET